MQKSKVFIKKVEKRGRLPIYEISTDTFLKFMDALIFACALNNNSIKFITFDSDFLDSKNLKEKFREVKIDDKA